MKPLSLIVLAAAGLLLVHTQYVASMPKDLGKTPPRHDAALVEVEVFDTKVSPEALMTSATFSAPVLTTPPAKKISAKLMDFSKSIDGFTTVAVKRQHVYDAQSISVRTKNTPDKDSASDGAAPPKKAAKIKVVPGMVEEGASIRARVMADASGGLSGLMMVSIGQLEQMEAFRVGEQSIELPRLSSQAFSFHLSEGVNKKRYGRYTVKATLTKIPGPK